MTPFVKVHHRFGTVFLTAVGKVKGERSVIVKRMTPLQAEAFAEQILEAAGRAAKIPKRPRLRVGTGKPV